MERLPAPMILRKASAYFDYGTGDDCSVIHLHDDSSVTDPSLLPIVYKGTARDSHLPSTVDARRRLRKRLSGDSRGGKQPCLEPMTWRVRHPSAATCPGIASGLHRPLAARQVRLSSSCWSLRKGGLLFRPAFLRYTERLALAPSRRPITKRPPADALRNPLGDWPRLPRFASHPERPMTFQNGRMTTTGGGLRPSSRDSRMAGAGGRATAEAVSRRASSASRHLVTRRWRRRWSEAGRRPTHRCSSDLLPSSLPRYR